MVSLPGTGRWTAALVDTCDSKVMDAGFMNQ